MSSSVYPSEYSLLSSIFPVCLFFLIKIELNSLSFVCTVICCNPFLISSAFIFCLYTNSLSEEKYGFSRIYSFSFISNTSSSIIPLFVINSISKLPFTSLIVASYSFFSAVSTNKISSVVFFLSPSPHISI